MVVVCALCACGNKHDAPPPAPAPIVKPAPLDAAVEIEAKKAAGYFAPLGIPGPLELSRPKGRALDD